MATTNRATGPKTTLQRAAQAVGAVFLLVGVLGFIPGITSNGTIVGHDTSANFVPVNSADNWLHLILGIAMIALAILLSRNTTRTTSSTSR